MAATVEVPNVFVQDTAGEVLRDVANGRTEREKVWIEVEGVHSTGELVANDGQVEFETAPNAPKVNIPDTQTLIIESPAGSTEVDLPRTTFTAFTGQATCGDASRRPEPTVAVGDSHGGLVLFDSHGIKIGSLGGHILHTYLARFFPSGDVLLSSGMDFALKIWDVSSGDLLRELRDQRGPVVDVGLIDRGRNFVSVCTRDDSVVMWETGAGVALHRYTISQPLAVAVGRVGPAKATEVDHANEFGVAGSVMAVSGSSGLQLYDLRARKLTAKVTAVPCTAVSLSGGTVAYSTHDGTNFIDLRQGGTALATINEASSQLILNGSHAALLSSRNSQVYSYDINSSRLTLKLTSLKTSSIATSSQADSTSLWTFGTSVRSFGL